jgi:DNA-binding NtrC family response regulator
LPACSVDNVLDILAKGPIHVLMTDERLAGMTGTGLIRWLEKLLIGTSTILLTSDPRILAEPWKFGGPEFNEVLSKPLQRDSLKRTLHRWLGRSATFVATSAAFITN